MKPAATVALTHCLACLCCGQLNRTLGLVLPVRATR